MTKSLQPISLRAILEQGRILKEQWPGISPLVKELMEFWKAERPEMAAQLQQAGALEAFARVQEAEMEELALQLRQTQGLPAQEALSQARQQVLQMTPEAWEKEDADLEGSEREEVGDLQNRQLHQERLAGDDLL